MDILSQLPKYLFFAVRRLFKANRIVRPSFSKLSSSYSSEDDFQYFVINNSIFIFMGNYYDLTKLNILDKEKNSLHTYSVYCGNHFPSYTICSKTKLDKATKEILKSAFFCTHTKNKVIIHKVSQTFSFVPPLNSYSFDYSFIFNNVRPLQFTSIQEL